MIECYKWIQYCLNHRVNKMERMPVFIKVEEYDEVLNLVRLIRKKLDESKD